ncbi:hypothetical protein M426DRAFT_63005 [Hypoxylon sp. CI-4A]|nr:hypothetical protein M426DRAFT_63005 [Hypoxylon sp. CI-4A]
MEFLKNEATKDFFLPTYILGVSLIILGLSLISFTRSPRRDGVLLAPVHGFRSSFEPSLLLRARFITGAYDIVSSGYKKFKNVPFMIRRYDNDVVVMPMKYLNELSHIPNKKFDSKAAAVGNFIPEWTWMTFAMESNLHIRVLNSKLTPELSRYLDIARSELDYAWDLEVPQADEWTKVDIQRIMQLLISRITNRIFMGTPACRDPVWINLTIDFAIDLFTAAFTLKMVPRWTVPFVAHFVPARYRVKGHIDRASRYVMRALEQYSENEEKGDREKMAEDEAVLLNWMMRNGTEKETMVPEMAARQCVLAVASVHTTAVSITNILFDLCAHPEWFLVLREEIDHVTQELGNLGAREDVDTKLWLSRLEKLDSFIVESQRLNPVMLVHPQRVATVPLTLEDGTHILARTHVGWAHYYYVMDPLVTPNPETFDPLRSFRKRYSSPEEMNKHVAGQTDPDRLSFGYGKQACPGRYFAMGEIKIMLVRLLSEYDFEFPQGKTRPKPMHANENVFVDPTARLMMKKRKNTSIIS